MTQITDLQSKSVPASGDKFVLRDTSTNTDKSTTMSGIKTAASPVVSVDSNGWIVYDYGSFQEYEYSYPAWSATSAYGAYGSANWNQFRATTLAPPVGKTWAALNGTCFASPNAAWGVGVVIDVRLLPNGTSMDVMTFNPTAASVTTVNMALVVTVQARTRA